jgi:putative transposase
MPRKARIDAPGALHHIIVRGINRRKIFFDADRDDFLDRLDDILSDSKTPCFAWALMTNHFHILLRTGTASLSTVMRRLLTGYAVSFDIEKTEHRVLDGERIRDERTANS